MMGSKFIAYARLLRLSGLIGFSTATLFGAFSQAGLSISLFTLFLLLILGILKTIHGCVTNDIFDSEVDKFSRDPQRRPLVTGEISKKTAVILSIITVIIAFAIVFRFFYTTQPAFSNIILCMILGLIIGNVYNKYGKKFIGSDLLVGFSEALFVIIGAYLVTPSGQLNLLTWVIFLLVFTQYLFMNMIIGGIKDADHDFLFKAKNVAIKTGVKISNNKTLYLPLSFITIGISIRLFSAALMFIPIFFLDISFQLWEISLIIVLVSIVLLSTFKLFSLHSLSDRKKTLSFLATQGVLRYCYVPFLLLPIIGLTVSLLLVLLPLIWFFIITFFSGQDIAPNL